MRASEARTGLSARPACHRSWLAYGTFSPLTPEVGAVCGKAARTDLCGGREVTRVPTAKVVIVAVHESGVGTKRTCCRSRLMSAIGDERTWLTGGPTSENDPKANWRGVR